MCYLWTDIAHSSSAIYVLVDISALDGDYSKLFFFCVDQGTQLQIKIMKGLRRAVASPGMCTNFLSCDCGWKLWLYRIKIQYFYNVSHPTGSFVQFRPPLNKLALVSSLNINNVLERKHDPYAILGNRDYLFYVSTAMGHDDHRYLFTFPVSCRTSTTWPTTHTLLVSVPYLDTQRKI